MKVKSINPPRSEVICQAIHLAGDSAIDSCVSPPTQFVVSFTFAAVQDTKLYLAVISALESAEQPQHIIDEVERIIKECGES